MPANRHPKHNKTSFKPGQSGNPRGMPRAARDVHRNLSLYALERIAQGRALVDKLIDIMDWAPDDSIESGQLPPTAREVIAAIKELREIALGSTMTAVEMQTLHSAALVDGESKRLEAKTDAELEAAADAQRARLIAGPTADE